MYPKLRCALVLFLSMGCFSNTVAAAELKAGLKEGKADLQSAGPLAFGLEGAILFAADPRGAAVFALAVDDKPATSIQPIRIEGLDAKIAALLGTTAENIRLVDVVANPASGAAYLSVARGQGPDAKPVLLRANAAGKLEVLSLEKVKFAKAALPDAPGPEAVGRRNRNLRLESITDLAFVDGRLLVAGLSNEEFASSLRSIPFPFSSVDKGTSVEIYHGAHGRFETRSPVRTFVPFDIAGQTHVVAAYTCTPLVKFPVAALKPGTHVKGTTIAELGNRNRPLDMIAYKKDGKDFLLMANSSRGIMKVSTDEFATAEPITERVSRGERAGTHYETIEAWKDIHQLDRLDDKHALVVRRAADGAFHLETLPLP